MSSFFEVRPRSLRPDELRARLDRVCGVHHGRIHVLLQLPRMRSQAAADAVLAALGKRPNERRPPRGNTRTWERIAACLAGEQIETVFLSGLENLLPDARHRLMELADSNELRIYVIATGRMRPWWGQFAKQWELIPVADDELASSLPAFELIAPPRVLFPQPPEAEVERFRFEASQTLSREDFKRLDAVFTDAYARTLERRRENPRTTAEELTAWLQSLLARSGSYFQAFVSLQGVAAAFRHTNVHNDIRVNTTKFARLAPLAYADDLEHGAADRLRWYVNNDCAAAALVRVISHCAPQDLVTLRLGDIAHDGSTVHVNGRAHRAPECAQGILRTQRIDRGFAGATDSDPAFIVESTSAEPSPVTLEGVRRWLSDVTTFANVVTADRWTSAETATGADWLKTVGVELGDFSGADAEETA
jgi:hypothetical protein